MTDELYHLWYSIGIVKMSMGGLCSLLKILQAAQVAAISLFSALMLMIPDIQKLSGMLKSTYKASQTLIPLVIFYIAMLDAAICC